MELNYVAILVASVLQFILGAIWYTPLFGKVWGKIHGFDRYTAEEQKVMTREMVPYLVIQFLVTVVTTTVLALFIKGLPSAWNIYGIAGFLWLGFVLPTQISAVMFGGTPKKWMVTKVAIASGASLICLLIAVQVLSM
jgi:hypothetical protein